MVTTPLVTAAWGPSHSEGNVQECARLWLWWESRGYRRIWESSMAEYTIRNTFIPCTAWPTVTLPAPTAQLLHGTLLFSKGRPGPGVRRPGHWGWLAAPWKWALKMSLLLPAEPSSHQCQIREGTYWFPKVLSPVMSGPRAKAPGGWLWGHLNLVKPNSVFPEWCNIKQAT